MSIKFSLVGCATDVLVPEVASMVQGIPETKVLENLRDGTFIATKDFAVLDLDRYLKGKLQSFDEKLFLEAKNEMVEWLMKSKIGEILLPFPIIICVFQKSLDPWEKELILDSDMFYCKKPNEYDFLPVEHRVSALKQPLYG